MLSYKQYYILQESYNKFLNKRKNSSKPQINESEYPIKDVKIVTSFEEPNRRFRGKDKEILKQKYNSKINNIIHPNNFADIKKDIKDTISPIFNIYITKHTIDQLQKRSSIHDKNYPLQSIELILPYIAKALLNGTLRPNSKFAFTFKGDHISYICTIDSFHSPDAIQNNNPVDTQLSPYIDIIVRSAIQPTHKTGEVFIDSWTKDLIF